jgi:hypothetical protein
MRAHEFIEPEEQLRLLDKIARHTRSEIENEIGARRLNHADADGDTPLDFLKRLFDVAWADLGAWMVINTNEPNEPSEPTSQNSAGDAGTVPKQSVTKPNKKAPVVRPSQSQATKPKRTQPVKAKPKKPKVVKPKKVKVPPKPEPVPQPVKRVTPPNPNPGQPLARIKPYGTMGLMK